VGSSEPGSAANVRPADPARAARAVAEFLAALGHDLDGELIGTPERVAAAWADDLVSGYRKSPERILREGSLELGTGPHGVVVLRDVAISVVCPHHLMPSHGVATVAYAPRTLAVGLGALAEAVLALAQRLTLQEALGRKVAETVVTALDATGALCRLDLTHTCFVARGERQVYSTLTTLAFAGTFGGPDRDLALAALAGRHDPPIGR